jgi:hypothetical protein
MDYRIVEVTAGDHVVYYAIEKKSSGFNWQLIRTRKEVIAFQHLSEARKYLAAMGFSSEVIRKVFVSN